MTIHINSLPEDLAREKILQHARIKKYELRAERWYGMVLHSGDLQMRQAVVLSDPWQPSSVMDATLAKLPRRSPAPLDQVSLRVGKIGRNEQCSCGSGLKFKSVVSIDERLGSVKCLQFKHLTEVYHGSPVQIPSRT